MLRTQVTQNHTPKSEILATSLVSEYGGHFSVYQNRAAKRARSAYWNWQLHGEHAAEFLSRVVDHLVLKHEQAVLAIAWHKQKPKPHRLATGHFAPYKHNEFDNKVAEIMKRLKLQNFQSVIAAQADLIDVVHELRQVLCVKG